MVRDVPYNSDVALTKSALFLIGIYSDCTDAFIYTTAQ
jgi:hypothetical protein